MNEKKRKSDCWLRSSNGHLLYRLSLARLKWIPRSLKTERKQNHSPFLISLSLRGWVIPSYRYLTVSHQVKSNVNERPSIAFHRFSSAVWVTAASWTSHSLKDTAQKETSNSKNRLFGPGIFLHVHLLDGCIQNYSFNHWVLLAAVCLCLFGFFLAASN